MFFKTHLLSLVNIYGPTEAAILSIKLGHASGRKGNERIMSNRNASRTTITIYLLDENKKIVHPDEIGGNIHCRCLVLVIGYNIT